MGIMVYSLLRVMQDFVHQQHDLGFMACANAQAQSQNQNEARSQSDARPLLSRSPKP